MIQFIKKIIKAILYVIHIDITKNQKYDRQTHQIMKRQIHENANCIDVGCHKGEMLEIMKKLSPLGKHMAFEPIPIMYNNLKNTFTNSNIEIYNIALSNEKGYTTFNYVKNAPAYSGLKQRKYDNKHPDIEIIKVETDLLDNIISENDTIDFIKIDVEGAEMLVMTGAIKTINRCKPSILFEFGIGGSDFYGATPQKLYDLLVNDCGLSIFTLKGWLKGSTPLELAELQTYFNNNKEYYFIASK